MRRILTLGFVFVLSLALAAPVLAEGSMPEAGWLFNWASVGTLINIHY